MSRLVLGTNVWVVCLPTLALASNGQLRGSVSDNETVDMLAASGRGTCEDTPHWNNGWKPCDKEPLGSDRAYCIPGKGWTCAGYVAKGWCAHNQCLQPSQTSGVYACGQNLNNPEHNCCACGKPSTMPHYILHAGYSCPAGYQHLADPAECQHASKQVVPNGVSLTIDYNTPSANLNPQYCYVYGDSAGGYTRLYWNPSGVTYGSWSYRNVICKVASAPPSPTPTPPTSNGAMIKWRANQNYCLSVDNNDASPGVKMQLWTCAGGSGQYFDLPPAWQRDYVRLHMDANYCVVVDNNANYNGARTQVWSPCKQNNQQWTLAPQAASTQEYAFQWSMGGKCLVVDNNQAFNGAKVNIWDCSSVSSYYKTWVVESA